LESSPRPKCRKIQLITHINYSDRNLSLLCQMGTQLPLPKKGRSSQFPAYIYCSQMAGWIKMLFGTEVGLRPSEIVLDADPAPLPKRGRSPQFSADICCGQMAGWMKMSLGMEVGLGPSHVVLDGDSAPPPPNWGRLRGTLQFSAHICCGKMAGWIKMALGTEVGLGPATLC